MTNEEAIKKLEYQRRDFNDRMIDYGGVNEAYDMAINALRTEPCEDCISRRAVLMELDKYLCGVPFDEKGIDEVIKELPSVQPEPKKGFISIADVMSVFDDFMCGDVDEDGNETFLEMLKDKAESEAKDEDGD